MTPNKKTYIIRFWKNKKTKGKGLTVKYPLDCVNNTLTSDYFYYLCKR